MGRALIIGGGIAGSVAAIALKEVGWEPVVYEEYGRTADGIGAFLGIWVNGLAALESIGLVDLIKDKSLDLPRGAIYLGASGKKLTEFLIGGELADGTVTQFVRRSDLYIPLRDEAVRRGVKVEYGKRLIEAERTATGVRARFEDGGYAEGDLLVGADGVHSRLRQIIDPTAPAARYVPFLEIDGETTGISVNVEPGVYNMLFGKRCLLCYHIAPQDGHIWWSASPRRRVEPTRAQLAAITEEQWRSELLGLFGDDRTPATQIIKAAQVFYPPRILHDFPTVPIWHRNRMIIIGDAAHAASPASGQGASMAIEDAVTLAKCLRDVSGVEQAFSAYERLRRKRVEAIVEYGKRIGNQVAPGPVGRILRNFFLTIMTMKVASTDRSWIWSYSVDWNKRIAV